MRRSDVERGPGDQRDGSQRTDESTRKGSIGIGVGAFVGALVGGAIGAVLDNFYLGIGIGAAIGVFLGFAIETRGGR